MVPIANASDGGGSIRIPASACGLVGLKPSQGRITLGPVRAEVGLGVEHCVSRTVRDTVVLLDAVRGPGIGDTVIAPVPERPYVDEVGADPGRLRIGLMDVHPRGEALDADCVAAVRSAAAMLEGLGHDVEPAWPAALADEGLTLKFMALWATQMAMAVNGFGQTLGRELTEDGRRAGQLDPGRARPPAERRRLRHGARRVLRVPARRAGVVERRAGTCCSRRRSPSRRRCCPSSIPVPGDPSAQMRRAGQWVAFTPAFNMSGQPAISLPLHWNDAGLPIGVQLVAAYGREDVLVRVAAQLEAAHPWADRRPPV